MDIQRDPYTLDPHSVLEPPTSFFGQLSYAGPGLVLSAAIVGSGELIATTALGAKAGFIALWVILVSCVVKVALQLQFGRRTILYGQTALDALDELKGPRFRGVGWAVAAWWLLQPLKFLQVGGIVGGLAMLMHSIVPVLSVSVWCGIASFSVALLVSMEGYRLIERTALGFLAAFTVLTLGSVIALQWTPLAFTFSDIASGLTGNLPSGEMMVVFGAFGLTGVGGDEVLQYTYWLLEKGYASYTGPRDESDPAWRQRARGWIRVMYLDALLSMVAYTTVTIAFYILGAAVLHAQDMAPEGHAMLETLASMYTDTLGPQAKGLFLLGAFCVLFSTLFSALAVWTRIYADALSKLGWGDFHDPDSRSHTVRFLAWFFPTAWAALYLLYNAPVAMVVLGGVATSVLLLLVTYAAIVFRYRESNDELRPGYFYDATLAISCVSIGVFAVYGLTRLFGGV